MAGKQHLNCSLHSQDSEHKNIASFTDAKKPSPIGVSDPRHLQCLLFTEHPCLTSGRTIPELTPVTLALTYTYRIWQQRSRQECPEAPTGPQHTSSVLLGWQGTKTPGKQKLKANHERYKCYYCYLGCEMIEPFHLTKK